MVSFRKFESVRSCLDVKSDQESYRIHIGAGNWPEMVAEIQRALHPTQVVVAMDETVAELYGSSVLNALRDSGFAAGQLRCPPGESSKSTDMANSWWQELAGQAVDRQAVVIALGGGVVGDLCGFVAATYLRGLKFVQVPTTLLAQVDSSVGGKVGINLPTGKNLVGCFWQPSLVWIDPSVLRTLSEREFSAGMAEVIKYAVLRDDGLLSLLEEHSTQILARETEVMGLLVHRCCAIKADIVQRDPRENNGIRATLNFGHTVGHAIESLTGYKSVLHGEGVAMGMIAEARLAERIGLAPLGLADRLVELVRQYRLPTNLPKFTWEQWHQSMRRDKKNMGQQIAFALPSAWGCVALTRDVSLADVKAIVCG
ncbi:MAG: 3-dehydroquinate synthase [Planctomycetaceae bacterium]|nr:3-dehydroquinate synthase [Planctomycetaceae bacterium]